MILTEPTVLSYLNHNTAERKCKWNIVHTGKGIGDKWEGRLVKIPLISALGARIRYNGGKW